VEEATGLGDLVRLMTFRQGRANLVEMTLPADTPHAGRAIGDIRLPDGAALVAILRGDEVIVPRLDDPLDADDELLFVARDEAEQEIRRALG
jgi:trk system potassium uptake protein TrkA